MIVKADKNKVEIFHKDAEAPFLVQESWPDGTPWGSDAEATAWGELFVLSVNPNHPTLPGNSPELPEVLKVAQPEIDPETGEPITEDSSESVDPAL